MKLIEIEIVKNEEDRKIAIKKLSEKMMKGLITKNKMTVILTTDLFAKIFSPRRLELLMVIAEKPSGSVSELAKNLKRKFEVVYRDLKLFEQFGFVKLTKEKRSVIPELIGEIRLPIIAYA